MIDVAKWFEVRALCTSKSHIKPPTYLFPRNPTTPFQSVCCNDSTPTTGQQPRSLAPFGRITRLTELGPDRAAVGSHGSHVMKHLQFDSWPSCVGSRKGPDGPAVPKFSVPLHCTVRRSTCRPFWHPNSILAARKAYRPIRPKDLFRSPCGRLMSGIRTAPVASTSTLNQANQGFMYSTTHLPRALDRVDDPPV